ncbi:MAG: asparagine synthase (glutamine-hydrolyzing) [bacterium]|nr:asparagine synthase (glutamine-hydrolyzing) [bacterium]
METPQNVLSIFLRKSSGAEADQEAITAMCGIVGIVGASRDFRADERVLDAMCQAIRHRGPDDQGIYANERVGLGMRRLSIIDLNTGHQPICNEDRSVWVVLNGEIYNYRELRSELEAGGHRFSTNSDTEVLVHLYEEYGDECVTHLRGMFGIALWDVRQQKLLLLRDRLGQKPIFYTVQKDCVVFASEMKAILEYPGISRDLNRQALDDYLTYAYVPAPATIFTVVRKLPPAHLLRLSLSADSAQTPLQERVNVERYWHVRYQADEPARSEAEYTRDILETLREAVRLRMIGDVPLGAFLSGGIDSSIIVALMSELSSQPVKTFSIGFGEKSYDEVEYAGIVAERYQTDHYEFQVTPQTRDIIEELVWHCDEPFADSSAIPTYYVSKCAREHVTVALSGDGGDEIFAGYRRYLGRKLAEGFNRIPEAVRHHVLDPLIARIPEGAGYTGKSVVKKLKRFAEQARDVERAPYSSRLAVVDEALKQMLYTPEMRQMIDGKAPFADLIPYFERCAELDAVTQMMWVDLQTYLPDDILVKVDRMSMAVSLESRSPFLDHVLIEALSRVPTNLKLKGMTPKYLLKKISQPFLPPEILTRPKQGFVVPIAAWLKSELRDFFQDAVLSASAHTRDFFERAALERVLNEHRQGKRDHSQALWAVLMFELWCRRFLEV